MNIISRRDAAEAGLKRYFTGKPCGAGHVEARYVVSGGCIKCLSQSQISTRKLQSEARRARFSCKRTYLVTPPSSVDETTFMTMMQSLGFECRPLADVTKAAPMQFREWMDDGAGMITRYDVNTGRLILKINPDGSSEYRDGTPGPQYERPPITGAAANAYEPPEGFDPTR